MNRRALLWVIPAICLARCCTAHGETIMNQLDMVFDQYYDQALSNAIGGDHFFGERHALQLSDDFRTTQTGHLLIEVQVGNLLFNGKSPTDARVSVYQRLGEGPRELEVYTARVSELGLELKNRSYNDGLFGLYGFITTISGLNVCLLPEHDYFIDVQVYTSPDEWAYTVRDVDQMSGADSFLRDGPTDEGEGAYGFTQWRSAEDVGYGAGDSAYRVEATSGICCLGTEQIARARCRARSRGNVLTLHLAAGFPGDSFDVALSTGQGHRGTLDAEGAARVRFKRLPAGEGTATATWGCGAMDTATYTCP